MRSRSAASRTEMARARRAAAAEAALVVRDLDVTSAGIVLKAIGWRPARASSMTGLAEPRQLELAPSFLAASSDARPSSSSARAAGDDRDL